MVENKVNKVGYDSAEKAASKSNNRTSDPKTLFVGSVLSMSWQMAVALLFPVLGSYYLGRYLKLGWLIYPGFVVGVLLAALVVKKTVDDLPDYTKNRINK